MLNNTVEEYILERLKAGDSASTIANTLHGWGWRTDAAFIDAEYSRPRSSSRVIHMVMGVIAASVLISGSVFLYNASSTGTQSIADAVVAPKTPPHQPPSISTAQTPSEAQVLGASTDTTTATTSATTTDPAASSSATVGQAEYSIALIGDSMIDTLDSHLPQLSQKLETKYNAKFKIYNYGIGAQNVEMGLASFSQPLNYKDREYPPLSQLKPDIIIIGSYAYNPFSVPDINKYWLTMAELAKNAQATGADVYFLADIAPLKEKFGTGSLDWATDIRAAHSQKIVDQLNSFVALSAALNIPLIDMYSISQANGQFGNGIYTDLHDGIHANTAGRELVINQIAKELKVE